MFRSFVFCLLVFGLMFVLSGCATAPGDNPAVKKQHIESLCDEMVLEAAIKNPRVHTKAVNAAGYGVFSNINVHIIWASGGNGYGVVVDNRTGEKTYMKMALGGVGFGLGAKGFRQLIIFKNARALNDFKRYGWEFGGHADAAAKAGYTGGALNAAGNISEDVEVYQITDTGLALQASVLAAKYWQDSELNGAYITSRN